MLPVFLIRASRSRGAAAVAEQALEHDRGWFSVRFGVVSLRHETVFT